MSKRKKTRQQKIIADLRRQITTVSPSLPKTDEHQNHQKQFTYSVNTSPIPTHHKYAVDNRIILHDLRKTILLTTIIVVNELLFLFLLKRHILSIPIIQY